MYVHVQCTIMKNCDSRETHGSSGILHPDQNKRDSDNPFRTVIVRKGQLLSEIKPHLREGYNGAVDSQNLYGDTICLLTLKLMPHAR